MLPLPTSSKRRYSLRNSQDFRHLSVQQRRSIQYLHTRSRLTNLGVLLLCLFTGISFLTNLAFIFSEPSPRYNDLDFDISTSNSASGSPQSILDTITRDGSLNLSHLIIVPGHAVWTGMLRSDIFDESKWILEPYQKGRGRIAAFYGHISRGVELALADDTALIVFSGGQTRSHSTTTEGESYLRLALTTDALQNSNTTVSRLSNSQDATTPSPTSFTRATTENYALDSYQNILFSIARFHEFTGRYPDQITVVGYEMKRRRFMDLHRRALRFPEHRFHYVGIDPVGEENSAAAEEGEFKNGFTPYSVDSYGCHDYLLSKRRQRNIFARFHPYYTSSPELRGLLNWCPSAVIGVDDATTIYKGPLPWDIYH
ncbi:hypothetical protein BJ138DRAFT_808448 [Hygrophoropsis aurantiaca]|uniref:Uncharacterized protein n=1 Tax=Hygrophoropsis aurantiaca TaxID=72124 RepID=A0ACB8AFX7_9AGAM|nr:hypothetical protein BJ138DRAFT_808448 [Hygrophoropsis aurantiaca]